MTDDPLIWKSIDRDQFPGLECPKCQKESNIDILMTMINYGGLILAQCPNCFTYFGRARQCPICHEIYDPQLKKCEKCAPKAMYECSKCHIEVMGLKNPKEYGVITLKCPKCTSGKLMYLRDFVEERQKEIEPSTPQQGSVR